MEEIKKPKRRSKKELEYFSFDCDLLLNKAFRRVKQKYGYLGPYIYISILCHIYGGEGYYVPYNDDLIWEIQLDLQGKYQPDDGTISDVVELLVESELFSDYHYQQKYLTSKRIQETYYRACIERTGIDINWDIWILSESEMKSISKNCFILREFLNRPNLELNRPNLEDNQSILQQTKLNKTKPNNTVVVGEKADNDKLFELFENGFGRTISQYEFETILEFGNEYTLELIREAIKESVSNNKTSVAYIRGILVNWKKDGIKTVEDAKKRADEFKRKTNQNTYSQRAF